MAICYAIIKKPLQRWWDFLKYLGYDLSLSPNLLLLLISIKSNFFHWKVQVRNLQVFRESSFCLKIFAQVVLKHRALYFLNLQISTFSSLLLPQPSFTFLPFLHLLFKLLLNINIYSIWLTLNKTDKIMYLNINYNHVTSEYPLLPPHQI